MDCFHECTPPNTAYGLLLKNQKELDGRMNIIEALVSELGYNTSILKPLTEFGTNTVIGYIFSELP